MRLSMTSCFLILSAVTAPLHAERAATVSRSAVLDHVKLLASDELGGRGVGTNGIEQAAAYIAGWFHAYGLQPGGDDGSYFQKFDIAGGRAPGPDTRLGRVMDQAEPWTTDRDYRVHAGSPDTSFEGPVVFAGYGIVSEDPAHDDYAQIDVTGRVVLVFRRGPPNWPTDFRTTAGRHTTFATKAEVAGERGAAAVLFVNPPRGDDDVLAAGASQPRLALPMFNITRDTADALLRSGGLEDLATLHDRVQIGVTASAALKNTTTGDHGGDVVIHGRPGLNNTEYVTRNVIGIVRGAGPLAHEFIVIGGHYDHLGTGPATRQAHLGHSTHPGTDKIHNGADDNASGIAGVLELARIFSAGPRPARSIAFMAYSGEELGLHGSRYYVEHPTVPIKDTVAMINLDMIGRLDDGTIQVYGSRSGAEFNDMIMAQADAMNLEIAFNDRGPGGSDHQPFYNEQIPVMFLHTGLHEHYHRPGDDWDTLDYDGMTQVVELAQRVTEQLLASETRATFKELPGRRGLRVRMGFRPAEGGAEGWPVETVVPDGPADRGGMKAGDLIIKVAGKTVTRMSEYAEALADAKPGDTVEVEIKRQEKTIILKIKLERR